MALVFDRKITEGFPYTPESQRGIKNPFVVTIKPIDSVRLVQLEDGLLKRGADNSLSISSGSYNVSLCVNGVSGWINMLDEKGKDIKITRGADGYISTESLKYLPTELITEIASVIAAVSQDPSKIQVYTEAE